MKDIINKIQDFSIRDMMEKIKRIKAELLAIILPENEIISLVNEVEIEMIELDAKIEAQYKTIDEATTGFNKYAEMYESAPIGYFTLNRLGQILEINLLGSEILGRSKLKLVNLLFGSFVSNDNLIIYNQFLEKVFSRQTREICELSILTDNKALYLYLSAIISENDNECLVVMVDISQRIKAEEELRKSELRYNNLFNNIDTGIVVHAPDTQVLLSNPRASDLLGLSIEQLKGKVAIDTEWKFINENKEVLPAEAYPVNRIVRKKMASKNQILGVCQPCTNDVVWVTVNGFPLLNKLGEITEIIISFNDITERINAEETLKQSQILLKACIESPKDMIIFSIDRDYNYMIFNQYHRLMTFKAYGIYIEQGTNMLECMSEDDRAKSTANFDRAFTGESHTTIEMYGTVEQSFFETKYNPIFNNENIIIGATAFSSNITDRIMVEEKLEESNAYLENIINYANAPMIVWDTEFHITRFNHAIEIMTGFHESDMIGQTLDKLFSPQNVESYMALVYKTITGERLESVEFEIQNSDKTIRTVIWNSSTLFEMDGTTPIATIAQGLDITDRKLADKKIKDLYDTLEMRVKKRTQQLEESVKELETFSYSVSHDLRSPLRHIIGFADLLLKEAGNKLSDDGQHYLSIIIDAAKKMGLLIDDLLNFSKTSRLELRKSPINMNKIIDNAKNQIQYPASNRKVTWQITKFPIVMGDYNLLLLVWVNLLDNALKYSRKRDETIIKIDFEENLDETIFSVTDNGVGFDMEYAGKLFGLFQRLHSSSEFEGTGIGLANVQRIIAKHGGRTWAKSEVDKGATFYFSLPKIKEA